MKIETDNYLTVAEAMEALGCPRRAVYRAIARAKLAGHDVTETVRGREMIVRKMLPTLKNFYFPYYSEAHQAMVREWGRKGGSAKARNAAAARPGGRKRAAASGTNDAQA